MIIFHAYWIKCHYNFFCFFLLIEKKKTPLQTDLTFWIWGML